MNRVSHATTLFVALVVMVIGTPAQAAEKISSEVTLFKNVNIFDGESNELKNGYDVLVVGNKIKKVAKDIPTTGSYEVDVRQVLLPT